MEWGPRYKISPLANSDFNSLSNLHAVSHNGCTNFHFNAQSQCSHSYCDLFFFFFNNTCFSWGKIASQNFNWHFSSVRAVHNFSVYNIIDYLNIGLLIFPI